MGNQVSYSAQKCFDCPDFDVCSSCYAIVPAQHPGHSFARLRDTMDLKPHSISPPVHPAGCNGCGKIIQGIRYKCMHPSCKDFDLCANCEALPIPVHPTAHAMLKIRQPGIYIPTVKRYGTESGPKEEDVQKGIHDLSSSFADLAIFQDQSTLINPSLVLSPVPSIILLPEAPPAPPTAVVPHSDTEPNTHDELTLGNVSLSWRTPSVVREGIDQPQTGRSSPTTTAPLIPVSSPPPALATEFIRADQNRLYIQEQSTSLPAPEIRAEPWWGQSPWIPPTPPAPLPVPLRTPSTPQCPQSSDPLVLFDEYDTAISTSDDTLATAPAVRSETDSCASHASLPHVPPTDFNELFDLASRFRHILELPPVVTPPALLVPPKETPAESEPERTLTVAEEVGVPTELTSTQVDDSGTPLSLVALLPTPEDAPRPGMFDSISPGRLLSQLLDSSSTPSLSPPVDKKKNSEEDPPLRASFITDNNIPDGQIFPPGAEFVKSWRMRNDGPGSWPAETELVFVAGDKLVIDKTERFKVGSVPPGEEVDVWTGEMKAPDIPGKYISYWRLCDSKGRRFGHSIWVE